MHLKSTPTLRIQYLEWVEDRIEEYKEGISRAELLDLAEEVIRDLRMDQEGQYQLTELLLCTAVDRRIFRKLRLPGYRTWCRLRREALAACPPDALIVEAIEEEVPLREVAIAR